MNQTVAPVRELTPRQKRKIKCVVWDLDNTLWDGTLLESGRVQLVPDAVSVIRTLDERGILHSIASRNDYAHAMQQLREFGLAEYFVHPQIHWNSKVESLRNIAQTLNLGMDALALVDDQPFERDEVSHSLPEVMCLDAAHPAQLLQLEELQPGLVTEDSKARRRMYLAEAVRTTEEGRFEGTPEEFLATLNMRFTIARATEDDLQRAEELTVRTHQMNTTGYTYSGEQLKSFLQSDSHLLLIAGLDDKYGAYGKVGLALLEMRPEVWTIKLFLMSCRVVARGVGTVFLNYILREARNRGVRLQAEFVPNEKNRMMHMTYKFAGFRPAAQRGEVQLFENSLQHIQDFPGYLTLLASLA